MGIWDKIYGYNHTKRCVEEYNKEFFGGRKDPNDAPNPYITKSGPGCGTLAVITVTVLAIGSYFAFAGDYNPKTPNQTITDTTQTIDNHMMVPVGNTIDSTLLSK